LQGNFPWAGEVFQDRLKCHSDTSLHTYYLPSHKAELKAEKHL
jgi:hypothetical protein